MEKLSMSNNIPSERIFNIEKIFPENEHYIPNIRKRLISLLDSYIERHGKVFVVRFTLTFPCGYCFDNSSRHISRFIAKLIQYLNRKGYDSKYLWAREQQSSECPHYHVAVIANGNKIQHPKTITDAAKALWGSTLQIDATGMVNYDCSQMIRRADINFYKQKERTFTLIRYLAKALSKGPTHDGVRNFGMSRLAAVQSMPMQNLDLFGEQL